jgi:hypothetical protein
MFGKYFKHDVHKIEYKPENVVHPLEMPLEYPAEYQVIKQEQSF